MVLVKKIVYLLLLVLLNRCGECDNSNSYQIRSVTPDATITLKCHYVAEGLGPCASWQKSQQIVFADSCNKFVLSQILSRTEISKYK